MSGLVLPGELLAVMGSSGAGKSTMLNALTFRNLAGLEVEGEIRAELKVDPKNSSSRKDRWIVESWISEWINLGNCRIEWIILNRANGVPMTPNAVASLSAYIQQDDLFIGILTVREQLEFQAKLR